MPTYPIFLPENPGVLSLVWQPRSRVVAQQSEFTLQEKRYVWSGQQRAFTASFQKMDVGEARDWQAAMLSLNGREGTFYFTDPTAGNLGGYCPDAYIGGQVDGNDQIGEYLNTKGWPANQANLFAPGDWISLADGDAERLFQVLETAASDGNGKARLLLWPKRRWPSGNGATIHVGSSSRGIFRLIEMPEFLWDLERMMSGFSFSAAEVIYAPEPVRASAGEGIFVSLGHENAEDIYNGFVAAEADRFDPSPELDLHATVVNPANLQFRLYRFTETQAFSGQGIYAYPNGGTNPFICPANERFQGVFELVYAWDVTNSTPVNIKPYLNTEDWFTLVAVIDTGETTPITIDIFSITGTQAVLDAKVDRGMAVPEPNADGGPFVFDTDSEHPVGSAYTTYHPLTYPPIGNVFQIFSAHYVWQMSTLDVNGDLPMVVNTNGPRWIPIRTDS